MRLSFLVYHSPGRRDDALAEIETCARAILDKLGRAEPDDFKAQLKIARGSTPTFNFAFIEADGPSPPSDALQDVAIDHGFLLYEATATPGQGGTDGLT